MEALSRRDVDSALAVVAAAAANGSGVPFGIETVDAIVQAIPADEAAYIEWRFGDRTSLYVGSAGPDFDDRDRAFLSLLRPHLARLRSPSEGRPRVPSLTERELEVLALVAQGLTNRQISSRLFISSATVRTHLEHIYDKLGVHNRAGAVSAAFRNAS